MRLTTPFQIYIMYYDNLRGILPLLIFPDESVKRDNKAMKPIYYHPIWTLSNKDESEFEYINLIYRGNIYIAKKYYFTIEKIGNKKFYVQPGFKKIVSILVLPKKLNSFRKICLKLTFEDTIRDFKPFFHKIICSEILKQDLIKIPKNKSIIREGEIIKENIRNMLKNIFLDQKQKFEYRKSKDRNLKQIEILI
ncbi:MAG: hypothetical protein ACFFD7_11015 [Candidatus Thorarchaeota archaeon]